MSAQYNKFNRFFFKRRAKFAIALVLVEILRQKLATKFTTLSTYLKGVGGKEKNFSSRKEKQIKIE